MQTLVPPGCYMVATVFLLAENAPNRNKQKQKRDTLLGRTKQRHTYLSEESDMLDVWQDIHTTGFELSHFN